MAPLPLRFGSVWLLHGLGTVPLRLGLIPGWARLNFPSDRLYLGLLKAPLWFGLGPAPVGLGLDPAWARRRSLFMSAWRRLGFGSALLRLGFRPP